MTYFKLAKKVLSEGNFFLTQIFSKLVQKDQTHIAIRNENKGNKEEEKGKN